MRRGACSYCLPHLSTDFCRYEDLLGADEDSDDLSAFQQTGESGLQQVGQHSGVKEHGRGFRAPSRGMLAGSPNLRHVSVCLSSVCTDVEQLFQADPAFPKQCPNMSMSTLAAALANRKRCR